MESTPVASIAENFIDSLKVILSSFMSQSTLKKEMKLKLKTLLGLNLTHGVLVDEEMVIMRHLDSCLISGGGMGVAW